MSLVDLFTAANALTSGMWGVTTPFLVLVIGYVALSPQGFAPAFAGASFIAFVVALPLFAMGVIADYIMVILVMLTLVGILLLMKK